MQAIKINLKLNGLEGTSASFIIPEIVHDSKNQSILECFSPYFWHCNIVVEGVNLLNVWKTM